MNSFTKMIAAGGIVVASAGAGFSQTEMMDPTTLTCADYMALDSDGMMSATVHIDAMLAMTPEEMTAAMAMTAEEKATKMSEMNNARAALTDDAKTTADAETQASMTKIMEACTAKPDATVLDAAKPAM